jgi:hypothetical protein
MTESQNTIVILKNEAGDYFLVPQATVEQGRVTEGQKVELEWLIGEQEDARGHMLHALFTPLAVITVGVVLIAQEATKDEGGTITNAQFVEQVTGRPFGR